MEIRFEAGKAFATPGEGGRTELPLLEPQPTAAGGAAVYTNGMMTVTRLDAPGQPPSIRFARGRMAFQDCAPAA